MASGGYKSIDKDSDETFDSLCTMCKRKQRNREAGKYCVNCHDYYCTTCVTVHEDVPSLSGHTILDKSQFPSGSSQTLPMAPTERCDKHSHKHIDMYCQNHDEVGCSTCIAVYHRSCQDTFYIPEFIQNNNNLSAADVIQRKLDTAEKILAEQHENIMQAKQKLLSNRTEILKNISGFRQEINEMLDEMEKTSSDEVESVFKALISDIEKEAKLIQNNKKAMQSARDKLTNPCKNISQFFVNEKKGNKIANIAPDCTEENKIQTPLVGIDFTVNQKLLDSLKEMNTLGEITQIKRKNEKKVASSDNNQKDQQTISNQSTKEKKHPVTSGNIQQRNVLLQGLRKKNYAVKVKSDNTECDIVSACALKDGTIILSDYNYNKELKRLDSSTYTVTDYCDLPDEPWQVCPITKQEVAVCLPRQKVVQFISVGSRMTKSREINTDFECYGLAYANDNLYISDSDTSVFIYNMTGRKLKEFSPYKSGQELFSNIFSLAVSKDGSRIYVADCHKGLIVLDNNGHVVRQFNGPMLKHANGCYLTDTGSLLVCGEDSNNVLQFGPDGELIGEVVKSDKNKQYRAVCCNQQMSKLILSLVFYDEIEVYDLV